MKIQSTTLISELINSTNENLAFAETLKTKSNDQLNWRADEKSWSILECLEHLNLYGDFYIPEIQKAILNATTRSEAIFKSGLVGNCFAQSMLPKENMTRMKTFKSKNPIHSRLDCKTIDRFIKQQLEMIDLLRQSRNISLNKEKTQITLTRCIRFKMGDTFRFVINHNFRHLKQIERVMQLGEMT